ncbi:MAG: UDP-glucose 6-dehydrogenase, partial [Bacteroidales bacterium]|nr:UDP-glucose 6-dehydrogenase [Bacteroidales bacterium]
MKYDVCVIGGCGHVGLPLAIMLAAKGKNVSIYDTNERNIEIVRSGVIPFSEEGAEELLRQALKDGKLHFSSVPEVLSESEIAILIIGTPV